MGTKNISAVYLKQNFATSKDLYSPAFQSEYVKIHLKNVLALEKESPTFSPSYEYR